MIESFARFSLLVQYSLLVSTAFAGGTLVYKAVLRSIRGEKKFDQGHELDMKALQAEVAELKETLKSAGLVRAEKHQPCADLKSTVYKKPEDVIRVFMMKEFMGRQLLDDLMVPEVRRTSKK